MPFNPPKLIEITSDGTQIEFIEEIKDRNNKKETLYKYRYTKAKTKKGLEFSMSEDDLKRNLRNFFKEIK